MYQATARKRMNFGVIRPTAVPNLREAHGTILKCLFRKRGKNIQASFLRSTQHHQRSMCFTEVPMSTHIFSLVEVVFISPLPTLLLFDFVK
jgi:hypothetical protein